MAKHDTATSFGLLLMRAAFGGMMLVHGWQKLTAFNELAAVFPDPLGMGSRWSLIAAIGAEFGCSALLITGMATRLAAIPLAFTMGVALFIVHGADPWQKKELAAAYLAAYLVLFFTGAGKFSLDGLLSRRKSEPSPAKAG